jgi:hypothetical protein
MADEPATRTGTLRVNLPKELLNASNRVAMPKQEPLKVEGWRRGLLARISELFVGKS